MKYTTTTINDRDLDYFKKLKDKHGLRNMPILFSRIVEMIKKLKVEDELR